MSLQSFLAGCVMVLGLVGVAAVSANDAGIPWISGTIVIVGTVWWVKAKLSPNHPDNR